MQEEQAAEHEAISDDQRLLADLESLANAKPMLSASTFVGEGDTEGVGLSRETTNA